MKRIITTAAALLIALPLFAAQRVPAKSGGTLDVKLNPGGAITIVGTSAAEVVVEATNDEGNVEVSRRGDTVTVERDMGRRVDLRIEVPSSFNIQLHTNGGGVSIANVSGTIKGRTMGGPLKLEKLRGKLDMETMGGNIDLTDSEVDGEVSTMGGRVLLKNVSGDINGKSMGGNVIYDNVTRPDGSTGKAVVISTMGGRIDVATAPAGADVKTMGGDIHIKQAAEYVKASTMGGDVRIDAVDGTVSASTMGGNVDVTVVGGSARDRDVELKSMGGEITLTLPANFAGTFDVEIIYTRNSRRDYKITSDFPLNITETPEWSYSRGVPRKTIRGTGGSGGNTVKIETTNGDVVIRKR